MEVDTPFEDLTFEDAVDTPEEDDIEDEKEEETPGEEEETASDEETQEEEEEIQDEETDEEEGEGEEEPSNEDDTDSEEEEEEEVSVIEALQAQTGIETEGEYEDNLDGAAEFINDAATQMAESQIAQTFEQFPEVQKFMEFRMNGGDPNEFVETYQTNWSDTEIVEDDPEQHKRIIRNRLQEEGYSEETIEDSIEDYETGGVLYNEAKRSLDRLQTLEEQKKEEIVEKQRKKAQDQQEQIEETWEEIEETVQNSDDLGGIPVPQSRKDDFFSWMREPVEEKNGQALSQRDKAAQNADLETLVTLDYVLYLMNDEDLSFSDIIDSKAKSEKAKDLESLLDNSKGKKKPNDKSTGPSNDGGSDEVDTEQLPDVTQLIS